jgi:hypothetical protein
MKRIHTRISWALALVLSASAAVAQVPAGGLTTKTAPATAADVKPGAPLRDVSGAPLGTIDSLSGQSVVINTGQSKVGVPLTMVEKDDKGLLLNITAKQFNDAAAKAHARSQAQQAPQQPQQPH